MVDYFPKVPIFLGSANNTRLSVFQFTSRFPGCRAPALVGNDVAIYLVLIQVYSSLENPVVGKVRQFSFGLVENHPYQDRSYTAQSHLGINLFLRVHNIWHVAFKAYGYYNRLAILKIYVCGTALTSGL